MTQVTSINQDAASLKLVLEISACDEGGLRLLCGDKGLTIVGDEEEAVLVHRLLVVLLHKMGLQATRLSALFNWGERQIRRLGDLCAELGLGKLWQKFCRGRQALSEEVRSFIMERYRELRSKCRDYTQKIIAEVKRYWPECSRGLSSSALRELFREADRRDAAEEVAEPGKSGHESGAKPEVSREGHPPTRQIDVRDESVPILVDQPQLPAVRLPMNHVERELYAQDNLHLGLSLCYPQLQAFGDHLLLQGVNPADTSLLMQVFSQVLLGAVNNESVRYLHLRSMKQLLGSYISDAAYQRKLLDKLDFGKIQRALIRANLYLLGGLEQDGFVPEQTLTAIAETSGKNLLPEPSRQGEAHAKRIIYYDPHSVPYSGQANVLRGFIASKKKIGKMCNIDFFHDLSGNPVHMFHADGFYDPRERFIMQLQDFAELFAEICLQPLLFIFDRGLYGLKHFADIRAAGHHYLTWEKNPPERWCRQTPKRELTISRCRNSKTDILQTHIEFFEIPWEKAPAVRNIIFRVEGKEHTLSVLLSDPGIEAARALELMARRWIQENDFAFLNREFGLHQISSYRHNPYTRNDCDPLSKQVITAEYKKITDEIRSLKNKIENFDLHYHRIKAGITDFAAKADSAEAELLQFIEENSESLKEQLAIKDKAQKQRQNQLELLEKQKPQTPRTEAKINRLAAEEKSKPAFQRKVLLDLLRIIARNTFIQARNCLRPYLDNYRIDTRITFQLLRSGGKFRKKQSLQIMLMPSLNLQPAQLRSLRQALRENPFPQFQLQLIGLSEQVYS